jgi:Tfp pilus assembly protein PilN
MIEINLLPGARKKKPARQASFDMSGSLAGLSGRFKDGVLIGSIAAGLLGSGALGWMYWSQTQETEQLTVELEQARRDSVANQKLFIENVRAEAMRDTLLRQVNLIRGLDQDRYIWPHVMEEVSRALPQYTWLRSLVISGTPQGSVNQAAPPPKTAASADTTKLARPVSIATSIKPDSVMVKILGQTVDIQAVPRFMSDLEASPFLGGPVSLQSTELAKEQQQDVTQFQLTFLYTRPDTAQLRRAALVIKTR